jgi:hypothetical protein
LYIFQNKSILAQGVRLLEKIYQIKCPRNLDADSFGIKESDPLIGEEKIVCG